MTSVYVNSQHERQLDLIAQCLALIALRERRAA